MKNCRNVEKIKIQTVEIKNENFFRFDLNSSLEGRKIVWPIENKATCAKEVEQSILYSEFLWKTLKKSN